MFQPFLRFKEDCDVYYYVYPAKRSFQPFLRFKAVGEEMTKRIVAALVSTLLEIQKKIAESLGVRTEPVSTLLEIQIPDLQQGFGAVFTQGFNPS